MSHSRQIVRMFHDDHMQALETLQRFGAAMRQHRAGFPAEPAAADEVRRRMREISLLIDGELATHFSFEEERLFPLLDTFGYDGIGELLTGEHETIRTTAHELLDRCSGASASVPDAAAWGVLCHLADAFVELMTGHIDKEEIGLLSALEDAIDEDVDGELTMAYAAAR